MGEAAWRKRYRAATIGFPQWARDDAERLLYVSNATGKMEVYAWDRRTGSHRQATDRPTGTARAQLDPAGRSIWWFDDDKGNEVGRWVVEPFDGGEPHVVDLPPAFATGLALGTQVQVASLAAEGVNHIFAVHHDAGTREIYAHPEAAAVAGVSRDEELVCMSHSEHGDSRNRALRVLTVDGETVAELWDGPGKGLSPGGWSRVPGDRRLIVSHERTGTARPAIWEPESGGDLNEIDIPLEGEIGASWYPDADALLIRRFWRGRSELYRYELASGQLERLDVPNGLIGAARIRPDGELWYSLNRSSAPPEVRCGDEILRPPGEPAPGGVAYSDVQAGEVHAFLAEPPGPRPHPTVLVVHGGPAGVDTDSFSPAVQAWVDHGCAVVMVNYRGSTGYGKAWRDAIVGRPGLCELEDIAAVREVLVQDGVADPSRMILSGGSWGGFLTLLGLGRQPELWSLGISGVPLADLVNHYHEQGDPTKAYWRALFGGTPDEVADHLAEASPINFVDKIAAPLLILAGENDPRCPIGQVLNYVKRLEAHAKTYQLYRYDAGHGSMVIDEQIRQMQMRLEFAAKYLGTTAPL